MTTAVTLTPPAHHYGAEMQVTTVRPDGVEHSSFRPWEPVGGRAALVAWADQLRVAADTLDRAQLEQLLVEAHAEAHRPHRQYDGWTDDVTLVRATTRVVTKGGEHAIPGDLGLAKPTVPGSLGYGSPSTRTVWWPRTGSQVMGRPTDVEEVGSDG